MYIYETFKLAYANIKVLLMSHIYNIICGREFI